MLQKVLFDGKSKGQTLAASLGIFSGFFLLLFALQVYVDVQVLSKGARDDNFLVINKILEKNYGKPLSFSREEFEEIKKQAFFKEVDAFVSNTYKVSLASQKMGFQTLLFFQSLSSDFLGIDTSNFTWQPGDKLSIVLSSDYLALYNFGFAPSQGLPKFSAASIGFVDFKVTISGQGRQETFDAYVYAFTPNVNSILTPPSFMQYVNDRYGEDRETKLPTQIIASTDNPYSVALEQFLAQQHYEIARGGLIGGELKSTLYLLAFLILIIALIIVGLAMLVFILNYQLLIAQSATSIQRLIQLGYTTSSIVKILSQNLLRLFALVSGLVLLGLFFTKYLLTGLIAAQGYALSYWLHPFVIAFGLAFCLFFVWVNLRSIRSNVRSLA